jgi:xyloglucan galactosyltransferase MUR3
LKRGEFHTDQYQLFSMIYHRAMSDPRRTMDPSLATTFIIPYDFANDCAYYKRCNNNVNNTCFDFRKCPLAPSVESLLLKSEFFRRNSGRDHLLVVGMNYAMDHYIGKPKCKSLLRGVCMNCTKLAIDDYSFLFPDEEGGVSERGNFWHAIPFPSNFHWNRYFERPFPWEGVDRPVLASYVGSGKSFYGPAKKLRTAIIFYCEKHPKICVHQSYGGKGKAERETFMMQGYNPLELSARSIFCFQPIGDLMTRKGLFDSLLQGCIPVMFDAMTGPVMYTWHWSESFWYDVSIELPFHPTAYRMFDPVSYLNELYRNNTDMIKRKLELIKERVFELQYSLDGRYYGNRHDIEEIPKHWPRYRDGKPMRDAYDIAMDLVLGWHSGRVADIRNGTVPECWNDAVVDKSINKCVRVPKNITK